MWWKLAKRSGGARGSDFEGVLYNVLGYFAMLLWMLCNFFCLLLSSFASWAKAWGAGMAVWGMQGSAYELMTCIVLICGIKKTACIHAALEPWVPMGHLHGKIPKPSKPPVSQQIWSRETFWYSKYRWYIGWHCQIVLRPHSETIPFWITQLHSQQSVASKVAIPCNLTRPTHQTPSPTLSP